MLQNFAQVGPLSRDSADSKSLKKSQSDRSSIMKSHSTIVHSDKENTQPTAREVGSRLVKVSVIAADD